MLGTRLKWGMVTKVPERVSAKVGILSLMMLMEVRCIESIAGGYDCGLFR
jgi:hypothetical protein